MPPADFHSAMLICCHEYIYNAPPMPLLRERARARSAKRVPRLLMLLYAAAMLPLIYAAIISSFSQYADG